MSTSCNVTFVTHEEARELISARVDGEIERADEQLLDDHIATCQQCRQYQDDAFALRRAFNVQPVVEPPESEPASVDLAGSLRGVTALRYALFVIGATLVIINVAAIVSPESGTAAHLSRHDGVFGTALGIGMLGVAAKPHRAIGLVPLTSALAALMAVAAIADLVNGNANWLGEAAHVLEFGGLICLWVISGGPSRVPQHVQRLRTLTS